jgi:hypothetical protein
MKKSVINQFENTLHRELGWDGDIIIEREDSDAWTTFYVTDKDNTTLYSATIKNVINVVEAYNLIEGNDVCFVIETRTYEGGWVKPVIKILISRK